MIEQSLLLKRIIRFALEEDIGLGDITTDAIIDSEVKGKASLIAREELILAGLPVFKMVFLELSSGIEFEEYFDEGSLIPEDSTVCLVKGPLSSILKAERTALNFLQRMSGIATMTRQYVKKAGSSKVRVIDTRKTVPGLRWLDKYAVRMGGGFNHRFGLFDGILIKENHIAVAGSVTKAIEKARNNAPHTLRIQVEVENLEELKEALHAGADAILLDNMSYEKMREAVKMANRKVILEASGGINLDTIQEVAKTGVDLISVGALTKSAKAADFSLQVIPGNIHAIEEK